MFDAAIIGAGYGGLGAALTLARAGAKVVLCEALSYPGGCASTFIRRGARFEAGATLFSGFGEGQLFARWIRELSLDVRFDLLDPVIELRAPGLTLPVPPDRARFVDGLCAIDGAPTEKIRAFFAEQRQVADALWALFDHPELLPPWDAAALWGLAGRAPSLLPLVRHVGRPLRSVLARHDLEGFEPLRVWLDAVCQITVQAGLDAEAPFALAAMDYPFRGTGHIHGGIGALGAALLGALEQHGGQVRLAQRVRSLQRDGEGWTLDVRGEPVRARQVFANLLPQGLRGLLPAGAALPSRLNTLAERVEQGWGAVMLYMVVEPAAVLRASPHHLEIVQDPSQPFVEGNHLFCSVSGADEDRGPGGARTVTVSTHVALAQLAALPPEEQGRRVAAIQETMRAGLRRLAPELMAGARAVMPGSPRTFARFTRRHLGFVGGVPRRAGLWNYDLDTMFPRPLLPGLYLVGDSVFPGQSTLAAALGGSRAAEHALRAEAGYW